jgi:hypothetical protein
LELQFQVSNQIIFLNWKLKTQTEILIVRIENNNLKIKYQILYQINFLNLDNFLKNWNSKFQIQIFKQRIPITTFRNKFEILDLNIFKLYIYNEFQ